MHSDNSADIVTILGNKNDNQGRGRIQTGTFKTEHRSNDLLNSSLWKTKEKPSHNLDIMLNNKDANLFSSASQNIGYNNKFLNDRKRNEIKVEESEDSYTKKVHKIRKNNKTNKNRPNNLNSFKMSQKNSLEEGKVQPKRSMNAPTNPVISNVTNNDASISYQVDETGATTTTATTTKQGTKSFEENNVIEGVESTNPFSNSNFAKDNPYQSSSNSRQTNVFKRDYVAAHQTPKYKKQDIKLYTKDAPPPTPPPNTKTKTLTIRMNMTKQKPQNVPRGGRDDRSTRNEGSRNDDAKSSLPENNSFLIGGKNDERKLESRVSENVNISKKPSDKNFSSRKLSLQYDATRNNISSGKFYASGDNIPNGKNNGNANERRDNQFNQLPRTSNNGKLHFSKSFDSQLYTSHYDQKQDDGNDQLNLKNFREKHDFGDFQIFTESPVKSQPSHSAKPTNKLPPSLTPQQLRVKRQILGKHSSIDV